MNFKLLSLLALFSLVAAQTESGAGTETGDGTGATPTTEVAGSGTGGAAPPSSTDIPLCISTCIQSSAQQANCNPTSQQCLCSQDFITAITPCVQQGCTDPADIAAASQLGATLQQECAGASGSGVPSGSVTPTGSVTTAATTRPTTTPGSISASTGTRPSSSLSSLSRSATGTGASTSQTSNAAAPIAVLGVWAMAAGLLGFAVAL